jgi:hypothetical protein
VKTNSMFSCTNVPSLRRYRCTHEQRVLLFFLCACCWVITHLVSPNTWTLDGVVIQNPKENDGPVISSTNRISSEECFDDPKSINCNISSSNNNNNNNKTTVSRYFNLTSKPYSTPPPPLATELRHNRHPNFTFDFPLCLVHVGKTAGSSISCGLGLMYADCEGMPRQPPIPHTGYFHMRKNNCLRNDEKDKQQIATLLMTVRNPLTRIRSWFNFEKDILPTRQNKQAEERLRWKRKMLFSDCYDNFVNLVTEGLELSPSATTNDSTNDANYEISTERPVNMTCKERAWAAILGVREFSYHEWYNYEHYWTALQNLYLGNNDSNSSLLVLRTEHLSEDWSKLSKEELFRQVNKGNRSASVSSPSLSSNTSTTLSSSNSYTSPKSGEVSSFIDDYSSRFWLNLCHAMCPEIQIYQQILKHANNMNASQVRESISEVQVMCPQYDYSKQRSCPGIPRFPLIKVPRRQYVAETKKRLFVIG